MLSSLTFFFGLLAAYFWLQKRHSRTLLNNVIESIKSGRNSILEKSIKLSKLSDFINTLPEGIETNLGDRGIRISGGQRQRVAIARAIFHERDLLLLDESTSALDAKTEKEVMHELIGLRKEKTIIAPGTFLTFGNNVNSLLKLNMSLTKLLAVP